MTYELAKELKDAGFPQRGNGEWEGDDNGQTPTYNPTLSELIEECVKLSVDGDFHLEHLMEGDENDWGAATCWLPVEKSEWYRSSTPKEAVARLWLALNSKSPRV